MLRQGFWFILYWIEADLVIICFAYLAPGPQYPAWIGLHKSCGLNVWYIINFRFYCCRRWVTVFAIKNDRGHCLVDHYVSRYALLRCKRFRSLNWHARRFHWLLEQALVLLWWLLQLETRWHGGGRDRALHQLCHCLDMLVSDNRRTWHLFGSDHQVEASPFLLTSHALHHVRICFKHVSYLRLHRVRRDLWPGRTLSLLLLPHEQCFEQRSLLMCIAEFLISLDACWLNTWVWQRYARDLLLLILRQINDGTTYAACATNHTQTICPVKFLCCSYSFQAAGRIHFH